MILINGPVINNYQKTSSKKVNKLFVKFWKFCVLSACFTWAYFCLLYMGIFCFINTRDFYLPSSINFISMYMLKFFKM